MLLKITTIALIPALFLQGKHVKKKTPKLFEPHGIREGQIGEGKSLSILIVGDSAAAGVGVENQNEALSGAILNELKDEYSINWKLHAKSGHSTPKVIQHISYLENKHYDVVVTSVGVNDVVTFMEPQSWIDKQHKLYQFIDDKFSPSLIIAAGVPPMHLFPALPNPLAWLFGLYATSMNDKLEKFVENRSNMQWIKYDIERYQALNLEMATDGFHPSKEVYALWGQQVAAKIRDKF